LLFSNEDEFGEHFGTFGQGGNQRRAAQGALPNGLHPRLVVKGRGEAFDFDAFYRRIAVFKTEMGEDIVQGAGERNLDVVDDKTLPGTLAGKAGGERGGQCPEEVFKGTGMGIFSSKLAAWPTTKEKLRLYTVDLRCPVTRARKRHWYCFASALSSANRFSSSVPAPFLTK
jgi:hypothetical protein